VWILLSFYGLFLVDIYLSTGTDIFHFSDIWRVMQLASVIAIPTYILLFIRYRDKLLVLDLLLIFLATIAWYAVSMFRDKSLMNLVIVEPSMVCLLYGVHVARLPISSVFRVPERTWASVTAICVLFAAGFIAWWMPFIGE